MSATIKQIALEKLVPHPGNPNRMSRGNFEKLVRNIEQTGRYEPLVVRPCPGRRGFFQIINGRHRCEALRRLGHPTAEAIIWNINDEQTDLLLASLNRLTGRDALDKKLALLERLTVTTGIRKLATLLPQTRGQLERLVHSKSAVRPAPRAPDAFAMPLVFFVDRAQEPAIEEALAQAATAQPETHTRAAQRGVALSRIARWFLERKSTATVPDAETATAGPAAVP
jgi:hypothetical protein